MRKVVYLTDINDYQAKSLSQLRSHVEFFNCVHKCNGYDRAYVYRYFLRAGTLVSDDTFIRQINVVNGKVIFRRVKDVVIPF